jgi:hypothetical protein
MWERPALDRSVERSSMVSVARVESIAITELIFFGGQTCERAIPPATGRVQAGSCKMSPLSGSNSVVECDLAKVEVAGSNPVSRSKYPALALASSLVREGFLG